jgi:hypothetical protein
MPAWESIYTWLPPGQVGKAETKHLTVTRAMAERSAMRAFSGEYPVSEGTYVQLFVKGRLLMSDTSMEKRTNSRAVFEATGDVLIFGLGIGMVAVAIACKPEVTSVTIVELEQDVIDLVEPHLRAKLGALSSKLKVVRGDAFTWKPEKDAQFSTIWFDIWSDQSPEDFPDFKRLKLRTTRWRAPKAWVGCWEVWGLRRYARAG